MIMSLKIERAGEGWIVTINNSQAVFTSATKLLKYIKVNICEGIRNTPINKPITENRLIKYRDKLKARLQ